jgi:hypothetical protein
LLLSVIFRRRAARPGKIWRWVGGAAAILLALPASELAMQWRSGRAGLAWTPTDEPLRQADPLIGWTAIPARRIIDPEFASRPLYVIDAHGYRVETGPLDMALPSILFAGESIMFGKGLNWPETVAGRVQKLSGIQSANLAVNAYSAGQVYLHLKRELPKFHRPVAVIILFAPTLLVRDLDRNRPWIDRAGRWHAAERTWYLSRLGRVLFPYRTPSAIEEAVATDRRLLLMWPWRARVARSRWFWFRFISPNGHASGRFGQRFSMAVASPMLSFRSTANGVSLRTLIPTRGLMQQWRERRGCASTNLAC